MKKNNLNEEINRIKNLMKSINEDEYNSDYNEFGYDFNENDGYYIDENDLPKDVTWEVVTTLDKISIHDESRHIKGWSQSENRFFEASGDFSLDELVELHDIEEISEEDYNKL